MTMSFAATLTLTGANTYTGVTTVSQGTLSASSIVVNSNSSNLGNATSAVVLGASSTSGLLSYTGNSATYIRGFTVNAGGGEIDVTTSGQTLTVSSSGISNSGTLTIAGAGDMTVSSVVSGTGSLTKSGTGTLMLSGANSYSGATTVAAGTLKTGATNTLSSISAVNVNASATVDLAGFTET